MFSKEFEKRAVSAGLFAKAVGSAVQRQGAGPVAQRLAKTTAQHADAGRVRSLVKRKAGLQEAFAAPKPSKPSGGTLDYKKIREEALNKNRGPVAPTKTPAGPVAPAPAPTIKPKGLQVGRSDQFVRHSGYATI